MYARHGRALMGERSRTCPGSGKCIAEQRKRQIKQCIEK